MTATSNVPRNKRTSRAGDGRFEAKLVTTEWMGRHDTDCTIVATKDKFGSSRNDVLDQGELST